MCVSWTRVPGEDGAGRGCVVPAEDAGDLVRVSAALDHDGGGEAGQVQVPACTTALLSLAF